MPETPSSAPSPPFPPERRRQHRFQRLDRPLEWIVVGLVLSGLATMVAEYGYHLSAATAALIRTLQSLIVWTFWLVLVLRLGLTPHPGRFLKQHPIQSVLMILLLLDLVATYTPVGPRWLVVLFQRLDLNHIVLLYIACIQGAILFSALFEGAYYGRVMATWQIRPAQTLVLSFAALILLGSVLLMLPKATSYEGSMPFLPALFTATSAVCVTGLIVVDTATYFTPLGQGIILGLLQLGGLGIITFATVIGMMVRGGPGIREKVVLQDFVRSRQFGEISVTIRRIVGLTLGLEMLGAISLYANLQGVLPDPGPRLWQAVFHAVSAFCNAGFSTFRDSLAGPDIAMHAGVNVTVMLLIILGGAGFVVLWEGGQRITGAMRGRRSRLSMQSRLVWITAALLIGFGAVALLWLEREGVMAGRPVQERILGALFQSVTTRTAGFNTLAIDHLTTPATFLLLLLMLIGAAPGSTGGGLKTTTVAVLLLTTVATIRGKARVELFHRSLPWGVINQAYATFFFAIAVITVSLFVLSITEDQPFLDLFFEEVSAFATVGLSRGITASLSSPGKVVIMVSMFVGRVGGLTLGVALARQVTTTAYEYPTESVMVG